MDKIQIGDCEVREDLLYAYLQAVENVAEGGDTWRLDTVRATHHHALLKSLGLIEAGKSGEMNTVQTGKNTNDNHGLNVPTIQKTRQ